MLANAVQECAQSLELLSENTLDREALTTRDVLNVGFASVVV